MDAVRQRDRALRRLSRLTTTAGVAGVVATIGFAGLAAATYRGHAPTPDAGTQPAGGSTTGGATTTGSQAVPTFAPVTGRHGNRQPVPVSPPRRSFGGGQLTSGGSG